MEEVRGLREGEITLWVDNRVRVAAVAIETYPLRLLLRINLILKDYYFVSIASQNLIFASALAQDRFDFYFNKDYYSIYLWNKLVIRNLLINSLYHLYVDVNVNVNKQEVSTVGHKRSRDDVNHKYMWHFRLGHIEEDRINKLKKNQILSSFNFESYPVCESYLRKEMIKLFFMGHGERVTKILILVHTDVCSPFDV